MGKKKVLSNVKKVSSKVKVEKEEKIPDILSCESCSHNKICSIWEGIERVVAKGLSTKLWKANDDAVPFQEIHTGIVSDFARTTAERCSFFYYYKK